MLDRFEQYIVDERSRTLAISMLRLVDPRNNLVCTIAPETRTQEQNRLMWPLLTDLSQQVTYADRVLSQGDWKNLCMGALNNAEFVPTLDGYGRMPLGLSTKVLSKTRFSELIDVIRAVGAERGVVFADQERAPIDAALARAKGE